MTKIVLFDDASLAAAQQLVRELESPLCWFRAPNGAIHDVAISELLAAQAPYVPSRPAIWPDLEMAMAVMPVEEPEVVQVSGARCQVSVSKKHLTPDT